MSVIRSFGDNLQKQSLRYMVGAGTGDQGAPGPKNLHGPKIDFFVATVGCRDAVAILGEGRRIEDHHVEAALFVVVLFEQIEGVSLFECDIRDLIQFLIATGCGYCGGREIDSLYIRSFSGHAKSEASVIAEAIENFAAGKVCSGFMIFALIEEAAGFLAVMQIVAEEQAVFVRADFLGDFAVKNRYALIQTFEQTHFRIIPFDDSARREKFDQQIDEQRLEAVR
jgi:hypothetical protein